MVKKAVIPAAGLGTRFLPATKALPKEVLPVVDRPMLHYVVEEAVAAGIREVVIVTARGKEPIADYFDPSPELERAIEKKGDMRLLEELRRISTMAQMVYVRQKEPLGFGDAVLTARVAVGKEPFALLLPDDILVGEEPAIGQLVRLFEQHQASVIAVEEMEGEAISAYGVIRPLPLGEGLYQVLDVVEKPRPAEAPSRLAVMGRYVLTPEIFEALGQLGPGALGEIQFTDGIALLGRWQKVYAYKVKGRRYDVGHPLGMLRASVELALRREDLAPAVREWLRSLHP